MANSPNSSHSNHENGELLRAPPSHASSSSNEGGNTTTETAKSMLRSQLLYASSISECLMPNNQSNHNNNNNNNILNILDYPTLCCHRAPPHLSSSHKQPSQQARLPITYLVDAPNSNPEVLQEIDIDDGDSDDGRIHSLPCKKNGPYTCSKCMQVFPTSQHFAAHAAADHYRYETREQRRKRQIAKVRRRRALKLQQVKDFGLTCAPIFYEWEDAGAAVLARKSSAEKSANGGGGGGGGKVKEEDSAGEVHGNDSVVPPGFEGICIKREASLQN